ncbi:hypothetical protein GN156_04045 [bacterium LRH843]|nr:hypothetical protein [bacterium LRH843]
MKFRITGVTQKNDEGKEIQDLLKRIANGYKKNDHIESWDGMTKREMLEYGEEQTEFEGQIILDAVRLVPEPTNTYDPNAIKVFIKDVNGGEHHVGYIKREDTAKVTELIQSDNFKSIDVSFTGGKHRSVEFDTVADEEYLKEEELTRGLEISIVIESRESTPIKVEPISTTKKLNKEEKLQRSKKIKEVGNEIQKAGNKMMGCGCLLTLVITIPIILIIIWFML